jgi:hypothetical protein
MVPIAWTEFTRVSVVVIVQGKLFECNVPGAGTYDALRAK